jgi:hypothetical protein
MAPNRFVSLVAALVVGLPSALWMAVAAAAESSGAEPDLGPSVIVFDPSMETPAMQKQVDSLYATQERGQFNSHRYAVLLRPGKYDLDIQVGFYTQVLGLGRSPDDVDVTGAVRVKANWMRNHNATCNFWRGVENLSVTPTVEGAVNVWAVSQATALRRVHVRGDLHLSDGGWSSGGFLADSVVDGQVNSGSQQQWLSRNADWGKWIGGSWNMVFVGVGHPPEGAWPAKPYTVIDETPIIREKPYLTIDEGGRYIVMVPDLAANGTRGVSWSSRLTPAAAISIDKFYVARSDKDDAASINAALEAGKNLLLTPGIYHLTDSLRVARPNAVVLGLGYATLQMDAAAPAIIVADVDGVTISGVLLEAGSAESPVLLQVGEPGSSASHADNPIVLHDIFCRAGGAVAGSATVFVTIHSNNVVGDNFWLWRADHGKGARWDVNKNRNGLIVNGDDVTIYGLFVEHCQEYQTVWNGERGRVYFYQSEMPYDPLAPEAWMHDGVRGYASYKVGDSVKTHEAWGLGVYCVFFDAPIVADMAIETPETPGVQMHHMVTCKFNGQAASGIQSVINGRGEAVIHAKSARVE